MNDPVRFTVVLEREEYDALQSYRISRRRSSLSDLVRELICSHGPIKERLEKEE